MPLKPVILVVDDEASIRESLEMFLRERGYAVSTAGTGREGLALWEKLRPTAVVLDMRLPDMSGLDILKSLSAPQRESKVIMITAFHDMESTIEAMRQGAYDYLHKPLDVDELDQAVARAVRLAEASRRAPALTGQEGAVQPGRHRLIGRTPSMRSIFKTIGLLARNRATVLIEGETGTGKELIARVIHESSLPEDQPLVTVDCTTLVDNLLESELFGHERGAFTGAVDSKPGRLELAGEGVIFFDEIGDLPLPLQAKMLRFLEYREFTRVGSAKVLRSRARIIAATNHDLAGLAARGAFRRDLLFRLKVISIKVPPLRERKEDIPEMVRYFVHQINGELSARVTRVEDGALALLLAHSWPGNVRELKNLLTKAVLESQGTVLMADTVEACLNQSDGPGPGGGPPSLEDLEKTHILEALEAAKWNISAAARTLCISRPTLRKRIARHGLKPQG